MGEQTTQPGPVEDPDASSMDADAADQPDADAADQPDADAADQPDAPDTADTSGDADASDEAEAPDDADASGDAGASEEADVEPEAEAVSVVDASAPADPSAAAGAFEAALWEAVAAAALLRAQPQFDETVLDAWCGDGSAALPTAALVGPFGRVDAIDPDAALVAVAQERAGAHLPQLHLEVVDPATWEQDGYDLVQCVLGLASCDTPDATARHLVTLARPGGRVLISLWAHDAFAPLDALAREAVAAEDTPDGEPADDAEDRDADGTDAEDRDADAASPEATAAPSGASAHPVPGTPGTLAALLHDLGLTDVRAERVDRHVDVDADLAWRLVVAAGLLPLDGLDEDLVERGRARFADAVTEREVTRVEVPTLIAVGRRPE